MFKKKRIFTRFTAIFLVAIMIISILPTSIFAGGYDFKEDFKDLEIRFWEDEEPGIGFYIDSSSKYILETVTKPSMGTISGEWSVMNLLRGMYTGYDYINHIPEDYFEGYLERIEDYVVSRNGNLDRNKSTEWSRLMLALSSLGYDVKSVAENHEGGPKGGYDFIEKLTDSYTFSYRQGINGPIWEIIAMNTGGYNFYEQPDNDDVNTFGKMLNYILEQEIKKDTDEAGGWSLAGFGPNPQPDPDITGMALQALAPYYLDKSLYEEIRDENLQGEDKSLPEYEEFASAVERGIYTLSKLQQDHGGYNAWDTVNVESTVQAVVALTALNIDPLSKDLYLPYIDKNCSFIKSGGDRGGLETNNMIDALLTFWAPGSGESSPEVGGFRHVTSGNDGGGGAGTNVNAMATDQALYGLIAYDRFLNNKNSLYDMTDMINGEYKDLMSDRTLDSKTFTFTLESEENPITERKSPYTVIELPEDKNVKDKVFRNWNTKKDGTGTIYKAGEYLSMPEKDIVLYAQYREKDEFTELKEIEPVYNIVVNKGTDSDEVRDLLAKTTTIKDTDNELYEVELNWEISDYNKDELGVYKAIGTFQLPDGVKNTNENLPLEVQANVRVSQEISQDELEFDTRGIITGYTGKDKDIVIPNKVGDNSITAIGENAFSGKDINTIFIPESVTTIGKNAFSNNQLKEVNIPDNISSIGASAFENNQLNKIKFPKGLLSLGNDAFRNNKLSEINIPDTLSSIGAGIFMNNNLVEVDIPNQIKSIGNNAFNKNKIEQLNLSNNLERIETGAFADNVLTNLEMPDTVVSIGNNAFGGNLLRELKLSKNLKEIKTNAFRQNQLTNINIPESVEEIGLEAFAHNKIKEEMARIDNYSKNVDLADNAFNNNGENKDANIRAIFLKDIEKDLKISQVELLKDNKIIAEGIISQDNFIKIQLPDDFPRTEIGKVGLGSYTLKIKGTENADIRQENGASGDWSNGKANTIDIDTPAKFTIEKHGIEKDYILEIISPNEQLVIDSINSIDPIEVDYGTNKEDVIEKLPNNIILNLSDKSRKEVPVSWTSEEYNSDKSGEYLFTANYNLPEGVAGDKLEVIIKVSVKEETKPEVDKSRLEFKINVINRLNKEIYTEETWSTLQEKLELGKLVLNNEESTEEEASKVIEELSNGIKGLEEIPRDQEIDKEELDKTIEMAKDLKEESYTEESWLVLQTILEEAKTVLDNEDATLGNIDQILAKLMVAIEDLEEKPEEITIIDVNQIDPIEVDYGTNEEDVMEKLPNNIILNLNDESTREVPVNWTSEEYNSNKSGEYLFIGKYNLPEGVTGDKLEVIAKVTVKEEVKPEVDKSILESRINEANKLNKEIYTEETWNILEEKLELSKTILNNKEANQDEVNKVLEELEEAIKGLEEIPEDKEESEDIEDNETSKEELVKMIKEAENLKEEDYTKESWNKLQTVLKEAKIVLNNKNATEEEVDEILEELIISIRNLVGKPEVEESEDPEEESVDSDKSDLPKTGSSSVTIYILLGLVLLVLGTRLWRKEKA